MEPGLRRGPLQRYAADAERRTMGLLDQLLEAGQASLPEETVRRRLLESAERDIVELRPQLEPRAGELAERAAESLRQRGEREAKELHETLLRQRRRVREELARHEAAPVQLDLELDLEDRRQLEANKRFWRLQLNRFEEGHREGTGADQGLLPRTRDSRGARRPRLPLARDRMTAS